MNILHIIFSKIAIVVSNLLAEALILLIFLFFVAKSLWIAGNGWFLGGGAFRAIVHSQELVARVPVFHLLEGQGAAVGVRAEGWPIINCSQTFTLLARCRIISGTLKWIWVRELEAEVHFIAATRLEVTKESVDAAVDWEGFVSCSHAASAYCPAFS